MRKDAHCDLDPRTARLAIVSVPRGIGLLSSAFGLRVARNTHTALLTRLALLVEVLPGSFADLEHELVHAFSLGWLDLSYTYAPPTRPAARAEPRHLVLASPRQLRYNAVLQMSRPEVAALLVELRRLGARAVPVSMAELQGTSLQDSFTAKKTAVCPESAYAMRELLEGMDAVYARVSRHDPSASPVYTAPDLQL